MTVASPDHHSPQSNPSKPWHQEAGEGAAYLFNAWASLGPKSFAFWLVIVLIGFPLLAAIL